MNRAIRMSTKPRRTFSIRTVMGLATGVLAITLLSPVAASAEPNSGIPLEQDCEDSSGVRVFQHPGSGRVLWELTSGDVTNGPNYLIKNLEIDVYVDGVFLLHDSLAYGKKTGLGEAFVCTFEEHFTAANGAPGVAYGTSYKVAIP